MVIGPIPFDMLMRPVKYVEGGGFLVATAQRENFFVRPGSPASVSKLSLPDTAYGPLNAAYATTYHAGVYLLSGHVNKSEGGQVAVIYRSSDAQTWKIAFTGPGEGDVESFTGALVWNNATAGKPGAFHASYVSGTPDPGNPFVANEYEISSADGIHWSNQIDLGVVDTEGSGYRSPFPGKYCGHHSCVDEFGQHVPDGFMGASVQPVMPAPVFYSQGVVVRPTKPSNEIKVISGATTTTKTVPVFEEVWCVAAIGGAWLAGSGFDEGLAYSSDGGKTWRKIDIDGYAGVNISGSS